MTASSSWIETEYDGGKLAPVRTRVEVRRDRFRIKTMWLIDGEWVSTKNHSWVESKGVHRLPENELTELAIRAHDEFISYVEEEHDGDFTQITLD